MTEISVSRSGTAELEFVDEIHSALEELWEGAPDVSEDDRALFGLAVVEIGTNIVVHSRSEHGPVELSVELTVGEELEAIFRDNAVPVQVDLSQVSMADAMAESGRGLAIAVAVLDELSVERRGGNVWRLCRRLSR